MDGITKTVDGINKMVGWHHHSVDMNLSKLWEIVKDRDA